MSGSLDITTVLSDAIRVLRDASADGKATLARRTAQAWRHTLHQATTEHTAEHTTEHTAALPTILPFAQDDMAFPLPDTPGRPVCPTLVSPALVPRRRLGTPVGRSRLIHAIAHIELNAIDLAFDMIARFSGDIPATHRIAFVSDWIQVGDEEARHFQMLQARLVQMGLTYGDFDAHGGLWEAATATAHSALARLAIAPLVLEARGLDVTPAMITKLDRTGDHESTAILRLIYEEEIGHVAIGVKWFKYLCTHHDLPPVSTFQTMVRQYFNGELKRPFNEQARQAAGLERIFYDSLAAP